MARLKGSYRVTILPHDEISISFRSGSKARIIRKSIFLNAKDGGVRLLDLQDTFSPSRPSLQFSYKHSKDLWVDVELQVSNDSWVWLHVRPHGMKWQILGSSIGDGLVEIVQTPSGYGFRRNSNEPEYWPPVTAFEVPVNIEPCIEKRHIKTDPRTPLKTVLTAKKQFRKTPLNPGVKA